MASQLSPAEIAVTRIINAQRDLVFKAFTDRELIFNWWGPHGFSTTTHEMNVTKGGVWRYTMHGPDGTDYPNRSTYTEVREPELIAYDHDSGDGTPLLFRATATFEPAGKRTRVTLRMVFSTSEQREAMVKFGAVEGGNETLTRLDDHLIGRALALRAVPEFSISRTFDAPRDLVWKVHSEPEHLAQWWGPKGSKVSVESIDFTPGGIFHYVMRYSTGTEMWGRFFYREIVAPSRLSYLNSFSNPGGGITRAPFSPVCPLEMLNTVTLVDQNGKTNLSLTSSPFGASEEENTYFANLFSSLEQGFCGTYDQLMHYLKRIA